MDPSGKVAGFTMFIQAEQLSAVLAGGEARLDTEPHRFQPPQAPEKPDIAPSYEVHISPSKAKGTEGSAGPGYWVQRGFDLKTMVSMVYEKDPSRLIIPEALDGGDRFDFVVVLPKEEDEMTIHQLVQHAIEKQCKVSAVLESKPAEVYVLTAIKGKTPPAKTGNDSLGGGLTTGFVFSLPEGTPNTPESMQKAVEELMRRPENMGISSVSAGNATMDQFPRDLEQGLGRPVIDETGLEGVYDLEVRGEARSTEEFIRNLREQLGLVLTSATRSIEFLTLRSLN